MAKIDELFRIMAEHGASDLHLISGQLPALRVHGELERIPGQAILTQDILRPLLHEILPESKMDQFESTGDVDFGYEIAGLARFRSNFFNHKHGLGAVFRKIPSKVLTAEELGLPPILTRAAMLKKGLVLVTGPTGSGKTNTLYSAVSTLNALEKNIMTAEDPVEFYIPGINQVNIKEEINLNFATALRAFLRQDPDIMLVGEMRDAETVDTAIKAALTGHLVFSTVHTNDAASTVHRLMNMNVEPFLIADSVILIAAQRLVRRLCKKCALPNKLSAKMLQEIGFLPEEAETVTPLQARGCEACNHTGYKGRTGLFEVMEVTPAIRDLILARAQAMDIKKKAVEQGMTTLRRSGLIKIKTGTTTIDEVLRETIKD